MFLQCDQGNVEMNLVIEAESETAVTLPVGSGECGFCQQVRHHAGVYSPWRTDIRIAGNGRFLF